MLQLINTITNTVTRLDLTTWIWIYATITGLAIVYFIIWRKQQLTDPKSTYNLQTTKRAKAVEQFQNMTKQTIIPSSTVKSKAVTTEQLARLTETAIDDKCAELPPFDELVPESRTYMLPEIHKAMADRLVSDKSANGASMGPSKDMLEILADNYPVIDAALTKFVTEMYTGFSSEYLTADRNNVYIRETNLDGQLGGFDDAVRRLTDTKIEGLLYDVFYNPGLADEAQRMVFIYKFGADFPPIRLQNTLIAREVRERLFGKVDNDSRRMFRDLCSINAQINKLEKELLMVDSTQALEINKQLDQLKFQQADQQSRYRLSLLVLAKLATKQATRETIQKQTESLAEMSIQPLSLNQADIIRGSPVIQRPDGTYASPGEVDLSRQYSGAYQQYLDDLKTREGDTILDPLRILGNLEEGTVNLLSGLSSDRGRPQEVQIRLGNQPNNLGTWMSTRASVSDANFRLGPAMTNREVGILSRKPTSTEPVKEGFQNTSDRGSSQATTTNSIITKNKSPAGLEGSLVGFAGYVMDILGSYIGQDTVQHAKTVVTDENNMVPIGFVLIILSILLYFIDISS
jgi:hypothetical protein